MWIPDAPYVFIVITGLVLTFALCKLVLFLFPKWGILDRPHVHGHARAPVPYSAGLVFVVSLAAIVLFFLHDENKALVLLAVSAFVTLVSFIDDRRGISPWGRLFAQGCSAVVLFFSGFQVATLTHPFTSGTLSLSQWPVALNVSGHLFEFSLLSLLITIAWIVLFMNTLNWLDGVPGMVSSISTLAFLTIFALSFSLASRSMAGMDEMYNATLVAQLALGLSAATCVFFFFDIPPPRMLMGDAGTMTLGLLIAALAIYAGSKVATTFLVLGFPIMDALFVIARRIYQGRSPFRGDSGHFHHRLMRIGFSQRQAVLTLCGICAIFGLSALLASSIGKVAIIICLLFFSITLEWWVWRREMRMKN